MDINEVLDTVLAVAAIVLACVAIWAIFVLVATVRDLRVAVEDVRSRLVPLLDKADVTVDAMNAELLRVDAIVTGRAPIATRPTSTRTTSPVRWWTSSTFRTGS